MKTSACDAGDDAGTTLLEVLLVIAIVSLILAATGFLARTGERVASLHSVAGASAELLNAARLKAARSGQPVRVGLDAATRVLRSPGLEPVVRAGEGTEIRLQVAREATDEQSLGIVFFPDGSSTGGRITFIDDRDTRVISVHWLTSMVFDDAR